MQVFSPTPATPPVACVLVNWNNWQDTAECLASLALQDYPALTVVVVDNGSTNDSLAQLRAAHPWATYVDSGSNAGFPKACNLGARHPAAASSELVWLLNNDTVVPSDTLTKLVAEAKANRNAGVVGGVLLYYHDPTRIQAWGGGTISRWSGFSRHLYSPTALGPNAYITFASALIRRKTFDQLGGLFEGVFMYFEDSDFCLRAVDAGWQLTVARDTAILHKEGGSVRAARRNLRLDRMVTASGLVFLGRHAPIRAIAWVLFVGSRLAQRLLRGDLRGIAAVLLGVHDWFRGCVAAAQP